MNRELLKEFVPPILLRARSAGFSKRNFSSFEDAAAACRRGYEDPELVEVVRLKTVKFRERIALGTQMPDAHVSQILTAVLKSTRNGIARVVDFGGACGAVYLQVKALAEPSIRLKWAIVETPAMARAGLETFADGQLSFFTRLEEALNWCDQPDLLLASGSLQYTADPVSTLAAFVNLNTAAIFISRLPLSTGPSPSIKIQRSRLSMNGPGDLMDGTHDRDCQYPVTLCSRAQIEEILRKSGFTVEWFGERQSATCWATRRKD